jgi:hypothetical protein
MGIEIDKHISADFKTLYIRQKIRRAKIPQDRCRAKRGGPVSHFGSHAQGLSGGAYCRISLPQSYRELSLTDESLETWITPGPGKTWGSQKRGFTFSAGSEQPGSARIGRRRTSFVSGSVTRTRRSRRAGQHESKDRINKTSVLPKRWRPKDQRDCCLHTYRSSFLLRRNGLVSDILCSYCIGITSTSASSVCRVPPSRTPWMGLTSL